MLRIFRVKGLGVLGFGGFRFFRVQGFGGSGCSGFMGFELSGFLGFLLFKVLRVQGLGFNVLRAQGF